MTKRNYQQKNKNDGNNKANNITEIEFETAVFLGFIRLFLYRELEFFCNKTVADNFISGPISCSVITHQQESKEYQEAILIPENWNADSQIIIWLQLTAKGWRPYDVRITANHIKFKDENSLDIHFGIRERMVENIGRIFMYNDTLGESRQLLESAIVHWNCTYGTELWNF